MWASASTNNEKLVRSDDRHHHRVIPVGATDLSSAKAYSGGGKTADTAASTLIGDEDIEHGGKRYMGGAEPATITIDDDLEMQQARSGVVVDRSYSVRSD